MTRQKGILMISFAISAGLISLFLILFLGHFQSLQAARVTRNDCRNQLQNILGRSLKPVQGALKLNPALQTLNNTIKISLIALAINPQNVVALKILLNAQKAREKVIKMQESLVKAAATSWEFHQITFPFNLPFSLNIVHKIQVKNVQIHMPNWTDWVRRQDPSNPYSLLEFDPEIENISRITKIWDQSLKNPKDKSKWKKEFTTKLGCQAFIKKGADQYGEFSLSEDKSLSNVRFFF
jgi:hypothetical protein